MTTKVHIVNFGPDAISFTLVEPATGAELQHAGKIPDLHAQQSADIYVHSGQDLVIKELKKN